MHSRSDMEIKLRLVLGLILLSLLVVVLLRLLLPVLAIAGFLSGGYWLWQQYRNQQQRYQRQQARIHAQFYQLLRQQQGRISVLDFAMRTRLSGADAQDYLNQQAQAFCAFFETTLSGDLIYVFTSSHAERTYQAQVYQSRVQTERAQAERAYAQQAQTAWTNAKQIRTLRELSKQGRAEIMREQIAQVALPQLKSDPSASQDTYTNSRTLQGQHSQPTSASSTQNSRYISIDIAQNAVDNGAVDNAVDDIEPTELEAANSRSHSQTIDVTAVRS